MDCIEFASLPLSTLLYMFTLLATTMQFEEEFVCKCVPRKRQRDCEYILDLFGMYCEIDR